MFQMTILGSTIQLSLVIFDLRLKGALEAQRRKRVWGFPAGRSAYYGRDDFHTLWAKSHEIRMCFVFSSWERQKGQHVGPSHPFFLEISPCKNFIMKSRPSEKVDFGETFCSPDALPKVSVIMVHCVCKKIVAISCRVLARSVSPPSGVFDITGYGGFTF